MLLIVMGIQGRNSRAADHRLKKKKERRRQDQTIG